MTSNIDIYSNEFNSNIDKHRSNIYQVGDLVVIDKSFENLQEFFKYFKSYEENYKRNFLAIYGYDTTKLINSIVNSMISDMPTKVYYITNNNKFTNDDDDSMYNDEDFVYSNVIVIKNNKMSDKEKFSLIKKLTSGDKAPSLIFNYYLGKFVICEMEHENIYDLATLYREIRIDSIKIN